MDGAFIALRGYKFQFDKTILEIFENPTKTIKIEQIQDYGFDDFIIQVKYHNTDFTGPQKKAKKKTPILQLLDECLKDDSKRFILYIYLKGVPPHKLQFNSVVELESIIGKKTKYKSETKENFIKKFTLIYASDFENQYKALIDRIKVNYSKTLEEAEIYYSIISSYLLDIVINNPPANKESRISSKSEIDKLINKGKKIIFKSAYIDELGRNKYHKYLRKLYFHTSLNSEPLERFFIIEIQKSANIQLVKEIVLFVKSKWSKNNTNRIPDSDRFAPYLYFYGISEKELAQLKKELHEEEFIIKDGFDFMDADFSLKSIQEKPTFANKIFFRIINKQWHLEELLKTKIKTKEVYQFFSTSPLNINTEIKHVKIEIQELSDIKNII